jgi:thiol-disulfide isomerase/thioredoxin
VDRLRDLSVEPNMKKFLALALLLSACTDEKPAGPPPSRFAAVKKDDANAQKAARTFCDATFPKGEQQKKLRDPPERAVPGTEASKRTPGHWRWVNLWATWCHPCVEEMGLLTRWRDSLKKDGVAVEMEMWSVDDDEAALTAYVKKNNLPGRVRWIASQDDLGPFLESLGASRTSAIPVHALVDADDAVRCVRVGGVHEEDYGAVKSMLTGS